MELRLGSRSSNTADKKMSALEPVGAGLTFPRGQSHRHVEGVRDGLPDAPPETISDRARVAPFHGEASALKV